MRFVHEVVLIRRNIMAVYNIPYNRQNDPSALFAQGFQNMVGGMQQGQQRRNLAGLIEDNQDATPMQIAGLLLSKGFGPQVAMGMGSFQRSGQIGPSQMMAGARWNRYQQAKAAGDTETADRLLSSSLVNFNVPLSPEDQAILNRIKVDKATGAAGPGHSPSDRKALAEDMNSRLENIGGAKWGPNLTEEDLFKQWQDFISVYTFDNDNQRENTWAMWKQKINARKKGWKNWVGKEVDWDPTDPKWRQEIGLKAPVEGYTQPKTSDDFRNRTSRITNEKQQELYYNKWKHLWPDIFE